MQGGKDMALAPITAELGAYMWAYNFTFTVSRNAQPCKSALINARYICLDTLSDIYLTMGTIQQSVYPLRCIILTYKFTVFVLLLMLR